MASNELINMIASAIPDKVKQDLIGSKLKDLGNSGVGTPQQMMEDINRYTTDPVYLQKAIERTNQVIAQRQLANLDTSAQENYLRKLMSVSGGAVNASPYADIEGFLRQYTNSYVQQQKAMLDAAKAAQIAELQKAYENAIAEGEMSVREAEAQFLAQKEEIEKQHYLDTEITKLYGHNMGIQNSQQMLGLMAGDNARKNTLINQNISERDRRINNIRDRINAIKAQKDLDIARVNAEYNAGLLSALAQANMMYGEKMFGLMQDDYRMNREYELRREEMRYGHTLDLEKMKVGHKLDLEKLAKQFDYDVAMENMRYGHESSLISQRAAAQAAAAKQEMLMRLQIEEEQYQRELERASRKFKEGTKEYEVFKNELEVERDERVRKIMEDSYVKATVKSVYENPYLPENIGIIDKYREPSLWDFMWWGYRGGQEGLLNTEYEKQQEAIRRRKELEDKYGFQF